MIKTKILTALLVLALSVSALLTSCGRNMISDTATESDTQSTQTEQGSAEGPVDSIIDDAQEKMRGMRNKAEDATHGIEDGTPGGYSTRGGAHMPLIPRGK